MALNNIIGPKDQQENAQGAPLAGGFVNLYEPGTTTFITAYGAADLVTPLSQPVRLSGSGRADIWITRDCDIVVQDRNLNTIWTQDNANPDDLGGDSTGGLVPNGSFEIVTTPPVPDGWVAVNEAGSTNGVDATEQTDGLNSYRFTSSGVGGGSLTTVDFFPVNDVDNLRVNFDILATLATVLNIVRVEWYDVTFISISNTDVYSSTANPLAWTEFQLVAAPPANARFAKLRLIGIDPSVPLAGSTYFDRISVFYPTVVSGIFDNITIQNNEIISTNLNGLIDLNPNGIGQVRLLNNALVRAVSDVASVGFAVRSDGNTDAEVRRVAFQHQDATLRGFVGHNGADGLVLRNQIDGGNILLRGNDIGSVGRDMLEGDPDGSLVMFHPASGFPRLTTNTTGRVLVQSDTDTDAEQRTVNFAHNDLTVRGQVGYLTDANLILRNIIDSGEVHLIGHDAGSVQRDLITGDPDGRVVLHQVGLAVARTITAATGGLQANNTLTGAGFERVLTTSDGALVNFIQQATDDTVNNTIVLLASELTFSNLPVGRYRIDLMVQARDVAVSNCGMRVQIATTGVGGESVMRGSVKNFAGSGVPATDIQGRAIDLFGFPSLSNGSATDEILFMGYIDFVSGTNSITVEFAQNTAQVGDLDFESGSFLALTFLGN